LVVEKVIEISSDLFRRVLQVLDIVKLCPVFFIDPLDHLVKIGNDYLERGQDDRIYSRLYPTIERKIAIDFTINISIAQSKH